MNIDTSWFKSKKSTHKNSWISRLENHKLSSPKKAWENNAKRQTLPTLFVTFPTDAHLGEANSRWQGMLYRCEDSKEATTRGTAGIQTQIIYLSSIYVHGISCIYVYTWITSILCISPRFLIFLLYMKLYFKQSCNLHVSFGRWPPTLNSAKGLESHDDWCAPVKHPV